MTDIIAFLKSYEGILTGEPPAKDQIEEKIASMINFGDLVVLSETGEVKKGFDVILICAIHLAFNNEPINSKFKPLPAPYPQLLQGIMPINGEWETFCQLAKYNIKSPVYGVVDIAPDEHLALIPVTETITQTTSEFDKWYDQSDFARIKADHLTPILQGILTDYSHIKFQREIKDRLLTELLSWEIRRQIVNKKFNGLPQLDYTKPLSEQLNKKSLWISLDDTLYTLVHNDVYNPCYDATKYLLEELEKKENPRHDASNMTIEHIMPQTRNPYWTHIDKDVHKKYLNTIGNLTLTDKNSELSNKAFDLKKEIYKTEYLALNSRLLELRDWSYQSIKARSDRMAKLIKEMLYVQGEENFETTTTITQKPKRLKVLGREFDVKSWVDVVALTVETLIECKPTGYQQIRAEFDQQFTVIKPEKYTARYLSTGEWLQIHGSSKELNSRLKKYLSIAGCEEGDFELIFE